MEFQRQKAEEQKRRQSLLAAWRRALRAPLFHISALQRKEAERKRKEELRKKQEELRKKKEARWGGPCGRGAELSGRPGIRSSHDVTSREGRDEAAEGASGATDQGGQGRLHGSEGWSFLIAGFAIAVLSWAGLHTPAEVIQKVAAATPENLEALEKELEECLKEHLEACRGDRTTTPPHSSVTLAASGSVLQDTGSQKDHMKSESDKCLDQAKKRIEMLNEAWAKHGKALTRRPLIYTVYTYTLISLICRRSERSESVGRRSERHRRRRRPTRRSGRRWSSAPRRGCTAISCCTYVAHVDGNLPEELLIELSQLLDTAETGVRGRVHDALPKPPTFCKGQRTLRTQPQNPQRKSLNPLKILETRHPKLLNPYKLSLRPRMNSAQVERLKEVCAPLEQGDTQSQEEVST